MSLMTAFSRLAGVRPEPEPILVDENHETRMALLARARRGRVGMVDVLQPPEPRTDMAREFVQWMQSHQGIDVHSMDERATARLDGFIDETRQSGHDVESDRMEQAAAWIGERLRQDQNLSWSEDGLVTDGRLAYDPAAALRARLSSSDAPTIEASIRDAMDRIEMETVAATTA